MEEYSLTTDAAVLMSRISTIDRDLDALERDTETMVEMGLRGGGAGGAGLIKMGEERADQKHAALLAERADLVARLKRMVPELPDANP